MLILKIGRTSLKTSLTKVTKSVFSATCYIPALRRAVLPSNDFIMCTDFPHWGFTSAPLVRRISHHEDERGTKRQGVRTPMMRCAVPDGVVAM